MKFKRAIALIMIFAVVFSLSACGSKKESDSKTLVKLSRTKLKEQTYSRSVGTTWFTSCSTARS